MIAMLDTSHDFAQCEAELGYPVEQLITPLTRYTRKVPNAKFAIDNGFFSKVDPKGFLSLLVRESAAKHLCRFVSVPDIVGSARRTLELFDEWKYQLPNWPLALVAQNGQEKEPIPWKEIDAIFIGGTDLGDGNGDWKRSKHAEDIIKTAKALGKWVHVGRVNTPERLERFEELGADSIGGTGLSRYSHMRQAILENKANPGLFT